jgi:hypothetical protein
VAVPVPVPPPVVDVFTSSLHPAMPEPTATTPAREKVREKSVKRVIEVMLENLPEPS